MASNMFVQFSNGVKGESEDENHPGSAGWSEITDVEFSVTQEASPAKTASTPTTVRGEQGGLTITKYIDTASAHYIKGCLAATVYDKVTIEFFRAFSQGGTSRPVPYLVLELKKVTIKDYGLGYKEGELPTDTLTLGYNEIKYGYTPVDKRTGAGKSVIPITFNFKE